MGDHPPPLAWQFSKSKSKLPALMVTRHQRRQYKGRRVGWSLILKLAIKEHQNPPFWGVLGRLITKKFGVFKYHALIYCSCLEARNLTEVCISARDALAQRNLHHAQLACNKNPFQASSQISSES
jgi:hypothetical protein